MSRHLIPILTLTGLLAACGPSYRDVYPKTPSGRAYAAYLHHQVALRQERFEDARGHLLDALNLDPDSPALHHAYANLLAHMGQPQRALDALQPLLEEHPSWALPQLTRARILFELGRLDEAAAQLDALLRLHPEHTRALWMRVQVALERDAAPLPHIARLLVHDPYHTRALRLSAELSAQARNTAAAIDAYELLTRLQPDDPTLYLELAHVYNNADSPEHVTLTLQRCVDAIPRICDEELARHVLAEHRLSAPSDAIYRLVERIAGNTELLVELAHELQSQDPSGLALLFIEATLTLRPDLSDLAIPLGDLLLNQERYEDALSAFARVHPDSRLKAAAELRAARTRLVLHTRSTDGLPSFHLGLAERHILRALEIQPQDPDALRTLALLADAQRDAGNADDARRLYQQALGLIGDTPVRDELLLKLEALTTSSP